MMQKNKYKILSLLAAILVVVACNEQYNLGEFDADSSLMPGVRTDAPMAPSAMQASYDDFCDKVELSWMPSVRTSAYDVYRNGELLAQDITDTFYVDASALTADTEYSVHAKNLNGSSENAALATGRMSATPLTPDNFVATDGEFETKVDLSWDAADFAKHYIVKRGDLVLSDMVEGTSFSDKEDAPQEDTEYSVIAVGVCGESTPATAIGKADSLLKYSIIIDENFDGYDAGFNLSSLDFYQHVIQYDMTGGPGSFKVSADESVSGAKSAKAVYDNVDDNTSKAGSIQVLFKNFTLMEGQRYRISYKLKCAIPTSMHIAVDGDGSGHPSKGDGADNYLLPTAVNTKNGNLFGIQLAAATEWTEISYEFPAQGDLVQNDLNPDPTELGWTPATIQAGQENPVISLTYWVGKNKAPNLQNPPIYLDDLKIELVK